MESDHSNPEAILIVDDDVRVVELLQITLGGRGYQVRAAYDGETALDMARQHRPSLIVLDVRLPRKGGLEVLDTIRRDTAMRHVPVILISADAATESRLQGLKMGADDYLTKPFSPRELIIKIRRILDRSQDHQLLLLKNEVLEEELRRGRDTMLQMRQELTQNLQRMGTILNQVVEFGRHQSIEEILEKFVLTTVGNLEFEQVALFTPEPDGMLRPRVWHGIVTRPIDGICLDPRGALAGVCLRVGRPLRMDEVEGQAETREELLRLSAVGLTVLVPAISGDRLEALLALGERQSKSLMNRFDYKLLEILGRAIVAALQNADAFERTQRSFLETTAGLIGNIEDRYPFLAGHSRRVREICLGLARSLNLPEDESESLGFGALLHDLGQLEHYRDLLDGSVILSPSDRRLQRRRAAEQGVQLLGPGGKSAVGEIVCHHMEYWNGAGFPDGLREHEIPLGARIVALANAWDALTHDRPHRRAYTPEDALRILQDRAGTQFDPALVELLVKTVTGNLAAVA